MKTEIKVEPDIELSDEERHKQMLADAVYYAVNLLKEDGVITRTVSSVISSESEDIAREICRRVKDLIHVPELTFIKVENEAVIESDSEEDFDAVSAQSALPENADTAGSSFGSNDNYEFEKLTEDCGNIPWDMKVKAVTLATLHPKWGLEAINKRTGNYLRTRHQLWIWKQAVKKSTVTENYGIISDMTLKRFEAATLRNESVSVRMIHNWAMQASRQFCSTSFRFRASDSWIFKFLRKNGLRECKSTGFLKK